MAGGEDAENCVEGRETHGKEHEENIVIDVHYFGCGYVIWDTEVSLGVWWRSWVSVFGSLVASFSNSLVSDGAFGDFLDKKGLNGVDFGVDIYHSPSFLGPFIALRLEI